MGNLRKIKKRQSKNKLEVLKPPIALNFFSYIADNQGCGHIRVIFPYLLLNHYNEISPVRIMATYGNKFVPDPNFYKDLVLCQFQRSATKQQRDMLAYFRNSICRQTKTPIVYEIDDLLTDIPEWNFANDWYKEQQSYIGEIMSLCDGMITSTEKLKQIYSKWNKNIQVIPNHLPKFLWGEPLPFKEELNHKPRIYWGGSSNHFSVKEGVDGGDFGTELIEYIKKTCDVYQWVLMGALPKELESVKDKIEFHQWQSIFKFPQYIKNLNIDIAIAPLQNNLFNNCKSNIKKLEYAILGCPGVYSNVEPYKDATLTCDTDVDIVNNIERLLKDVDLRREVYTRDFENVREQLFWEEHGNLTKYINTYLRLFGRKLVP